MNSILQIRYSLLLLIPIVLCSNTFDADPWELMKEEDGVIVYTRTHGGTKLLEFRAETTINARLSSLVSVVKDLEDATELFAAVETIDLIEEINDYEWVARAALNVPFPLDKREMVIKMVLNQDTSSNKVTISIINVPKAIPVNKDFIRLPLVKGFFEFTPLEHGNVKVVYQNVSDPAGNIPAWLINLATVKAPFTTMSNLKELAKRDKHVKRSFSYIEG